MKYIILAFLLLCVVLFFAQIKSREGLMQFDMITMQPLTTFGRKSMTVTFPPMPNPA